MGGNALKEYGVGRLDRGDFYSLQAYIKQELLQAGFHLDDIHFIKSYGDKETFGDMDILINKRGGVNTFFLESFLEDKAVIQNSHCYSTLYEWRGKKFQVDFITEKDQNFPFASHYFNYNDLGNLIGRIAHKAGFKFGHDGLWVKVRDGNYKVGDVCLTKDFTKAIQFLGLSSSNYEIGFPSLESIFKFVSNSPYFDPNSYSLENRSHNARVRDKKRPTYRAFLEWLECNDIQPGVALRTKEDWLEYAWVCWPDAKKEYESVLEKRKVKREVARKFNGSRIMQLTPLEGKELGDFIRVFKGEVASTLQSFDQWVLKTPQESVDKTIIALYNHLHLNRR